MKNKSKLLLAALILSVAYLIYGITYINGLSPSSNTAEDVGTAIGVMLIVPHFVIVAVATLFNGLGLFLNKRGFALTAAILYSVSIIFMPIYIMFVLVQAILCYVAFAKMKTTINTKVVVNEVIIEKEMHQSTDEKKKVKTNDDKPYIMILGGINIGLLIVILLLLYCVYILSK